MSVRHDRCGEPWQVTPDQDRMVPVNSLRKAVSAALVAMTLTLQPVSSMAGDDQSRRARHEDRRDYDRYDARDHDRYDNRYDDRYDSRDDNRRYRADWRYYDERRFEPGQSRYDAARYYVRNDRRYGAQRLYRNDRIYRGYDDRYYCRRDDGTTGLIVGGIAGGVLGQIIAPGGYKTLGAIIGAGTGALIGRQVDRGDVVCR
jgi:glycine zipper 2TM protein